MNTKLFPFTELITHGANITFKSSCQALFLASSN